MWARGNTVLSDTSTADQHQTSQSHPAFPVGPQPLLTAQQLASAVAGVMPGGTPALNQPILIPFNMAGQLGGQQGLVLTLPTANLTNIQGLVAAAAAGGIMTLPLQNLQDIFWAWSRTTEVNRNYSADISEHRFRIYISMILAYRFLACGSS
ncbi:hypothetical protein Y1Q_0017519 [Alligator mississippiensis]|uniref:POU domain, class 6, transcription factor 2 n=1 Tax=Alligator mississippiensis TaxID=8496 RepID=A0A151P293_ALLMI|nr:hypothetical protein Y1Q_0017519 [Alligator mississippiensis]